MKPTAAYQQPIQLWMNELNSSLSMDYSVIIYVCIAPTYFAWIFNRNLFCTTFYAALQHSNAFKRRCENSRSVDILHRIWWRSFLRGLLITNLTSSVRWWKKKFFLFSLTSYDISMLLSFYHIYRKYESWWISNAPFNR